ncbi:MAG: hypothetical protein IFK94_01090 [Acidobacteria bacterium]|uniref:Uncharacterized protein n=1 Tax=Candidatus Polarisedimenticola svalbardensis TaxID=2886004 RepID=A0A8J6XZZ2_9BACT|nr:hypothetical protein [Candidatus Polarisedimenticola svalbardensis]
MPRSRHILIFLLALAGSFCTASAQTVDEVRPLEPEWRETVGPRPVFKIEVEGTDLVKMRFRLVLSQDDFDTEMYVFNQIEEPNGWSFTALMGEYGAMFKPPKPLEDGRYQWRADAWNGVDWVEGEDYSEVDVDSIPPAYVDRLEMDVEQGGTGIVLAWNPVTIDQDGRPEYVEKYHVYRYIRRSFFFVIRPFEIAVTDETKFVDRAEIALVTPLVFYKVTAEDVAGNEPDRRY